MWSKKLLLGLLFLLITTPLFAHSGRIDGTGGHRVNKEWTYSGKYIDINDNIPEIKDGNVVFFIGSYHFHCKPTHNKIDLSTYKDGIYIPVIYGEIKDTSTSGIKVSDENVVASKKSNLYHNPDCKYIKNIKEENIIIFEDKEDAEKSGYLPDKTCSADKVGSGE